MRKPCISSRPAKTSADPFDPFENRLARDIRNTLATAFVDALKQGDKLRFQNTAEQFLASNLDDVYVGYIQNRVKRFDHVYDQIKANRITDAKLQALIIWNNGLFFEVHEHLERVWQKTAGDEYQALKGLIQAAGVYVHMKFNHRPAAERLALKSSNRIQKHSDHLAFIANLNVLLDKLKNPASQPPRLKSRLEISAPKTRKHQGLK
jgi:hypothetical protein